MKKPRKLPDALWAKVVADGQCWSWAGHVGRNGYGMASHEGRNVSSHRLFYELLVGPIPKGLVIDHLCRNRRCANPKHLEPVTHKENTRRSPIMIKDQCPRGHDYTAVDKQVGLRRITYKVCKTCRGAYRGLADTGNLST